jgi:5'-3' exonuclease
MVNFIFIDGSYYCFYRYFAIENWFKLAKPEEKITNPIENETFVAKFRKTFIDKIKEIPKKLGIENPIIIVGKDCPRKEIWRMKLFNDYKKNRDKNTGFQGGPFFKMAYDDNLFTAAGCNLILYHDNLEADDCIALTVKHIRKKFPDANSWIIASDMDYLQIASDKVQIFTLKFKNLQDSKKSFKDADKDLFCKIVSGDKSDGIPSVFKKCGIKTAEKLWNDRDLFHKKLEQSPECNDIYKRNCEIIDFNNIPTVLQQSFNYKYGLV